MGSSQKEIKMQEPADSIQFICPNCGLETDVDREFAGQTGPCAGCGTTVQVPEAPPVAARKKQFNNLVMIFGLIVVVVALTTLSVMAIVWISMPAITAARNNTRNARCRENLKKIHDAMQAYHRDKGHYPPAYTVDENGKPLHSWRTLLLPYLGPQSQMIFKSIRLDEPWDGPRNTWAFAQTPPEYTCPTDPDRQNGMTSYVVVNAPGMLFNNEKKLTELDLRRGDGKSQTILVVEATESNIPWGEPKDMDLQALSQGINSGIAGTCCSQHAENGVHVLFADGEVRFLTDFVTAEELRQMCTVAGGEIIRPESLTYD